MNSRVVFRSVRVAPLKKPKNVPTIWQERSRPYGTDEFGREGRTRTYQRAGTQFNNSGQGVRVRVCFWPLTSGLQALAVFRQGYGVTVSC